MRGDHRMAEVEFFQEAGIGYFTCFVFGRGVLML